MSHKSSLNLILIGLGVWAVLVSAGPTLALLMKAAVPLVIAVGIVAVALRLTLFHTRKW